MVTENRNRWAITIGALIGVVTLLVVLLGLALPAQAASEAHHWNECRTHKYIERWTSEEQLRAKGFFVDVFGEQASLGFEREHWYKFLALDVAAIPPADPMPPYVASRITEVDTSLPVDQRVKCWQPTERRDVVVEFTVRFELPVSPGLTENMLLWNAPLGVNPMPMTAFGVSRSVMSPNPYQYAAVYAQDFNFADFSGLLYIVPMPDWLDATKWHKVRITITDTTALVEVAQGRHRYTPVVPVINEQPLLPVPLLHLPEKMAFEFSVDNEMIPGVTVPTAADDGLDVGSLEIQLDH